VQEFSTLLKTDLKGRRKDY